METPTPRDWPARIAGRIAAEGPRVRAVIIRAEGSSPRETGAAMIVGARGIEDTIGGGALEFEVIAHARRLIAAAEGGPAWRRETRDIALGPALGQCCGGAVRVLLELFTARERTALAVLADGAGRRTAVVRPLTSGVPLQTTGADSQPLPAPVASALRRVRVQGGPPAALLIPGRKGDPDWFAEPLAPLDAPLFLYGAGHVGRALVRVLEGLPFAVTWVDVEAARFPEPVPPRVARCIAADPAVIARQAPAGAIHLVMTHSHPLDLAICHAVLEAGHFAHLGLIGSATKRARFETRLTALGIAPDRLARLVCPIGLPEVAGKQPAAIAVAVAARLLMPET